MRTTLNIDDDVLLAVKDIAAKENSSVGRVVSRLVRLGIQQPYRENPKITYRNGVPILPSRGVVVTNEMIDRIWEEEGI